MKTIFRYATMAVLVAALIVLGSAAGLAQDPCADAEGQTALGDKFRTDFADKTIEGRKKAIESGKQFVEKYGACESAKELGDYLKGQIPKMETALKALQEKKVKDDLIARFNNGLTSKNWDEVYSAGKEILAKYPDEFRDVALALGSIGYDESFKNNFKYNEETVKYAKMSISDLEAGKAFSASFGVPKDFVYKSKDNALGWMNMTIGYITSVAQKNKAGALPFLFKATQSTATTPDSTAKNPIPYELIGYYYFEELNKLSTEITAMIADQKESDTPEVAKQKVDAIKAKVALSNGMSERAMDAFSRAFSLSKTTAEAKPYRDKMKKNIDDAYKRRFGKMDGLDAWITATLKKPFADPTSPVEPISDPEPVTPTATSTTTTTTTDPSVKPTTPATKPPATTPVKPATTTTAKPVVSTKPQAKVKKAAAKKKGA